jgi:hypothetical protein
MLNLHFYARPGNLAPTVIAIVTGVPGIVPFFNHFPLRSVYITGAAEVRKVLRKLFATKSDPDVR